MKKNRTGQALVEFALVFPIFIFVVLGLIDFSRVFHAWSTLNFQCVQAARAAAVRLDPIIARNVFGSGTHTSLATVTATFDQFRSPMMIPSLYHDRGFSGVGESAASVTVYAQYDLELLTPGIAALIGSSAKPGFITFSARAQEIKE